MLCTVNTRLNVKDTAPPPEHHNDTIQISFRAPMTWNVIDEGYAYK